MTLTTHPPAGPDGDGRTGGLHEAERAAVAGGSAGPDSPAHPGTVARPDAPAGPREAPKARLYVLDLLRFAAASWVVMYHLLSDDKGAWGQVDKTDVFGQPLLGVAKYGWLGVEIFFVISGFVICMSCWGRSLSAFFTSRVIRIVPAYLVAVLLTAAVLVLWPLPEGRPEPSHVMINLTLMQGFLGIANIDAVYWTLFVELKFYLIFAIVVAFGLTYRRVVLFCMLWTVLSLFALSSGNVLMGQLFEPRFANYFVAGITLYLIHRFGPNLMLWAILGMSAILSLFALSNRISPFNEVRHTISFPVAAAVVCAYYLVMVGVALGWFNWLRWRGLVVIGALTYPLYLLHAQIGRVALSRFGGTVPPWVLLGAVVAGALLLAYLVYRLVERPGSAYLRRGLRESFAQMRATR